MDDLSKTMIALGVILLIGFITETVGSKTKLPRVTLLLIFGFFIGHSALNFLPKQVHAWFPLVTNIALSMIGFILGSKLCAKSLHHNLRQVLWISIAEAIITALIVFLGLVIFGVNKEIALLLAAISAATAPAATADVVLESKKKNSFARTLLGIVALDDAWALIIFSVFLAIIQASIGDASISHFLLLSAWEIIGAILLGVVIGFPMAYLTGRIKPGEPTLIEALGLIFAASGIALWAHVSFIITAMTIGFIVASFAKHHKQPFHEIENIEKPFLILFFILAGASLHLNTLLIAGPLLAFYIVFRIAGRVFGAWLGGSISHANKHVKRWMGLALLPQAGVSVGMMLVAAQLFPALGKILLPVVLAATVIFEIIGPVLTKLALEKSAES